MGLGSICIKPLRGVSTGCLQTCQAKYRASKPTLDSAKPKTRFESCTFDSAAARHRLKSKTWSEASKVKSLEAPLQPQAWAQKPLPPLEVTLPTGAPSWQPDAQPCPDSPAAKNLRGLRGSSSTFRCGCAVRLSQSDVAGLTIERL